MKTFNYVITDEVGIHARPAGMLVKEAKKYESQIMIKKGDKQAGLVVDELIGQQEIVIKSLGKYINNSNKTISGATILGDGEVALIIDVNTLF